MRTLQKRFELWAVKEGLPLFKDDAGSYEDDRTGAAYKAYRSAAKGMLDRVVIELNRSLDANSDINDGFMIFIKSIEGLDK